jgi:hypothetical protein
MTKRFVPMLCLLAACSTGATDESPSSFSASFGSADMAEGDGDGDDDPTTGDGDPSTGDGDPTTGDGDGEPTTTGDGDGDGDEDPCPVICDGKPDGTPISCAAPYIIGRTDAKAGFFFGGSTHGSMDTDNERCGPNADPANWDSGRDHFFRIYLVVGDTVTAVQNPNGWDARLKIHDEADCVGDAKECSVEADPAELIEYEAPKTDWFTIVADGQSAGFMDWGDYTLTVDLVTGAGIDECGCP